MVTKEFKQLVVVKEDDSGLYFDIAPEILTELGWVAGDTLYWEDLGDGRWSVSNKKMQNFNPVCTICTPGECVHIN
jgi:hypothetical protein